MLENVQKIMVRGPALDAEKAVAKAKAAAAKADAAAGSLILQSLALPWTTMVNGCSGRTSEARRASLTFNATVERSGKLLMATKTSSKIASRANQEVCLCSCGRISTAVQQVTMRRNLTEQTRASTTWSVVEHAVQVCARSATVLSFVDVTRMAESISLHWRFAVQSAFLALLQ